jgi:CRISPR/Cas system-associated endonuclease Cas1
LVLSKHNHKNEADLLRTYTKNILPNDITNREGHAAKVYFNTLFGMNFNRRDENIETNQVLNYLYSILLSITSR